MAQTASTTAVRPSKTAEIAAAARADCYRYIDNPPFKDDLAIHFTGPIWGTVLAFRWLREFVAYKLLAKVFRTSPVIVFRAVFGEEQILAAVEAGIRQYVILGAGYDTFAMRRQDLADRLTVYEVDQAATQQEKFRRMDKAGIARPDHVVYVEADFEREQLHDVLVKSGLDLAQPAMFSWFGVTYYLSQEAIQATLSTIADHMAPGSSIMFDYTSDLAVTPPEWKEVHEETAAFVAKRGEPWISSFDPPQLAAYLQDLGYADIEHLAPTDVAPRYLAGRTDIVYPAYMGLCRATTRRA